MNGDARPFRGRLRHHLVGFLQVDAERFFDVDVGSVFEHPQGQGVVELGAGWNGDDVGAGFADHEVQVAVTDFDPQLVPQGVAAFRDQVAEGYQPGARVVVVGAGGGGTAAAAAEDCNIVCFHEQRGI